MEQMDINILSTKQMNY